MKFSVHTGVKLGTGKSLFP